MSDERKIFNNTYAEPLLKSLLVRAKFGEDRAANKSAQASGVGSLLLGLPCILFVCLFMRLLFFAPMLCHQHRRTVGQTKDEHGVL